MKLILARHGETFENKSGVHQTFDSKLTEKGIEQAKKISKRLKNFKIDFAYSSDLDRALQTSSEILKYHKDIKLLVVKDLREQDKGIYKGRNSGISDRMPDYPKFIFPEGESLTDTWNRVIPFIENIRSKYKNNENILIVSHLGPISCILSYLHNLKVDDCFSFYPNKNTAISIIEFIDNKPKFVVLNNSDHLDN